MARVSPDGRSAVQFRRGSSGKSALMVADLQSKKPPLAILEAESTPILATTVWTPDNKQIILSFASTKAKDRYETWKINVDGSEHVKLPIPELEQVIDVSTDGLWFLTRSARPPWAGQVLSNTWSRATFLMRQDGTEERLVLEGTRSEDTLGIAWEYHEPQGLSPDGHTVAFSTIRWANVDGKREVLGVDLSLIDSDGKNRRRLFEGTSQRSFLGSKWSPDGRFLALTKRETDGDKAFKLFPNNRAGNAVVEIVDREGKLIQSLRLPQSPMWYIDDWR